MNGNEEKLRRMRELNALLGEASRAYYQESREVMSNLEYDALYDELAALERETGVVLSGSVTQNVGYEVLSELPKVRHDSPMLSLDKTKSVEQLQSWLGSEKAVLSWKLDGLTIVLNYEDGRLQSAVTRGNGYVGELITDNARNFENVPLAIPFAGRLTLRGEAVISYRDFSRINEALEGTDAKYKNPRNLCSGSVRQLDPAVTKSRHVQFHAFALVSAEGEDFGNSRSRQFEWLREQGFAVVEHRVVDAASLPAEVEAFAERIGTFDIPSDGLVLLLEDIAYGESLGTTAKFPRNAIAFKWTDELSETKLKYIEWSASRTGLINPVAVFEPVEIEGTTVSRASVHNLSILEALQLGEGDVITVYKANMIIPQIAEDLTRSGTCRAPERCPVCGEATKIRQEGDVRTLYCVNPDCPAKKIKSYALLASRDALNIDGLSEMTLEKLIAAGFVRTPADLFRLEEHRAEIAGLEGFGEKSADNLIAAARKASETTVDRFLYALGIPGIGSANAKALSRHFGGDFDALRRAGREELTAIDGIGAVLADAVAEFFSSERNAAVVDELLGQVRFSAPEPEPAGTVLAGLTFVITGSVSHFANRKEVEKAIEERGGRTASSVSSNTSYLINNDVTSGSGKNKKARELGIPVISEEEFMKLAGIGLP